MADVANANVWVVECFASDSEIKRRLTLRTGDADETPSNGRWELDARQKADWEPITEMPDRNHIRLDTSGKPRHTVNQLAQKLFTRILSS